MFIGVVRVMQSVSGPQKIMGLSSAPSSITRGRGEEKLALSPSAWLTHVAEKGNACRFGVHSATGKENLTTVAWARRSSLLLCFTPWRGVGVLLASIFLDSRPLPHQTTFEGGKGKINLPKPSTYLSSHIGKSKSFLRNHPSPNQSKLLSLVPVLFRTGSHAHP